MLVTLRGYRVNEINNANTKNLLNNIINQRKMFLLVTGIRQKKKVGGRTLDLPESGTILIHFLLEIVLLIILQRESTCLSPQNNYLTLGAAVPGRLTARTQERGFTFAH